MGRGWMAGLLVLELSAQGTSLKPFRESPAASVSQALGISTLRVDYHRPAVKGRSIWGGLVPFGQVWRAGANDATTLTVSDAVTIQGKPLPAGSYALFLEPQAERWTWIFSRKAKQWGAYFHKAEDEVLRVTTPVQTIPPVERLRFDVDLLQDRGWRLTLAWDARAAALDLDLDARGLYWKHLEATLAQAKETDWAPWYQAAAYCLSQETRLDQAHDWLDISLKAQESFWNQELKAKFLRRLNQTAQALERLDRALVLAEGKAPKEYLDGLRALRAAWQATPDVELAKPKCCK